MILSGGALRLAEKILELPELQERPPVLLDIGSSGFIPPKWNWISSYATCLAFDADLRDVQHLHNGQGGFRNLHVFPAVVSAEKCETMSFFLSKSPYCSSALPPDTKALEKWAFADLFSTVRKVELPSTTLLEAMVDAGVEKIDWFKCDSQGTDLRLFRSLGVEIMSRVLVADFEPGIINAYQGEDKLWSLMSFMDDQPFWMSEMRVKGSQRVNPALVKKHLGSFWARLTPRLLRSAPGWAEVTYFNDFDDGRAPMNKRDYLLAWVFAVLEKQFGYALELAASGEGQFDDPIFSEMRQVSTMKLQTGCCKLPWKFLAGVVSLVRHRLAMIKRSRK